MVFYLESVQLKNKLIVRDQLLIFGASMNCFGRPGDASPLEAE